MLRLDFHICPQHWSSSPDPLPATPSTTHTLPTASLSTALSTTRDELETIGRSCEAEQMVLPPMKRISPASIEVLGNEAVGRLPTSLCSSSWTSAVPHAFQWEVSLDRHSRCWRGCQRCHAAGNRVHSLALGASRRFKRGPCHRAVCLYRVAYRSFYEEWEASTLN